MVVLINISKIVKKLKEIFGLIKTGYFQILGIVKHNAKQNKMYKRQKSI